MPASWVFMQGDPTAFKALMAADLVTDRVDAALATGDRWVAVLCEAHTDPDDADSETYTRTVLMRADAVVAIAPDPGG